MCALIRPCFHALTFQYTAHCKAQSLFNIVQPLTSSSVLPYHFDGNLLIVFPLVASIDRPFWDHSWQIGNAVLFKSQHYFRYGTCMYARSFFCIICSVGIEFSKLYEHNTSMGINIRVGKNCSSGGCHREPKGYFIFEVARHRHTYFVPTPVPEEKLGP